MTRNTEKYWKVELEFTVTCYFKAISQPFPSNTFCWLAPYAVVVLDVCLVKSIHLSQINGIPPPTMFVLRRALQRIHWTLIMAMADRCGGVNLFFPEACKLTFCPGNVLCMLMAYFLFDIMLVSQCLKAQTKCFCLMHFVITLFWQQQKVDLTCILSVIQVKWFLFHLEQIPYPVITTLTIKVPQFSFRSFVSLSLWLGTDANRSMRACASACIWKNGCVWAGCEHSQE